MEAILDFVEATIGFCGGYTKSDQLLCHSQLELRLSWAVTIFFLLLTKIILEYTEAAFYKMMFDLDG